MKNMRLWLIATALVAAIGIVPATRIPLLHAVQSITDRFDPRPARSILIVGNSRTYFNDMPDMIRAMADSAGDPEKYQITTYAVAGASLKSHWNDSTARSLLQRHWDNVLIQAESAAHGAPDRQESFFLYGEKLIREVQRTGSAPALIVNWDYDLSLFEGGRSDRSLYYATIQKDHAALAQKTGADRVNVGAAWEGLLAAKPQFSLYAAGGNHPSIYGSYFMALMIYAHLSHSDASRVTYVPWGIGEDEAALMKRVAAEYRSELPPLRH
jgi:hypothetical protein